MSKIQELKEKIEKLEKAIKSPATPNEMKEGFKETKTKLEGMLADEEAKEKEKEEKKEEPKPKKVKAAKPKKEGAEKKSKTKILGGVAKMDISKDKNVVFYKGKSYTLDECDDLFKAWNMKKKAAAKSSEKSVQRPITEKVLDKAETTIKQVLSDKTAKKKIEENPKQAKRELAKVEKTMRSFLDAVEEFLGKKIPDSKVNKIFSFFKDINLMENGGALSYADVYDGRSAEFAKGGKIEQNLKVGNIVELSEAGWDNDSYHDFFDGKDDVKLVITNVYKNKSEHQGFDEYMGMALYSTKRIDNGEEVPFDLYDYELEYVSKGDKKKYANGGSMSDDAPRIYVADLAAYNNGQLVGEWLDLSDYDSGEEVMDAITELLEKWSEESGEEREEFAIHDYENFDSSLYDEYMGEDDFDMVVKSYKLAKDRDVPTSVISYIMRKYQPDDIEDWFDDRYEGQFDSDEDLAYHYVDMIGGLENVGQDTLEIYFDYESFGRDLAYDYTEVDGYYFRTYKKGGSIKKYDLNKYMKKK